VQIKIAFNTGQAEEMELSVKQARSIDRHRHSPRGATTKQRLSPIPITNYNQYAMQVKVENSNKSSKIEAVTILVH